MVRAMLRRFGGEAGVAIRAAFRRFFCGGAGLQRFGRRFAGFGGVLWLGRGVGGVGGGVLGLGRLFLTGGGGGEKFFCKNGLKTIDIVS